MAGPKRPTPETFHPPVGVSDEVYATSRRWLATLAMLLIAAAAAVGSIARA